MKKIDAVEAENIYMKARGDAMHSMSHEYRTPVQQSEANKKGWEAVIDAVRRECDLDCIEKLMTAGKVEM